VVPAVHLTNLHARHVAAELVGGIASPRKPTVSTLLEGESESPAVDEQ
jgi:hypothetical protein